MGIENFNWSIMEDLIYQIAKEIETQTASFEHFKNFDARRCTFSLRIHYSNNIQSVPNPDYEELVKREKELDRVRPVRLRQPIPKEIPSYPERDGIDLSIEIIPPEIEKGMMRVILPYTRMRGWAVEVAVRGADTKELEDIRKIIYSIIDREKEKFEG